MKWIGLIVLLTAAGPCHADSPVFGDRFVARSADAYLEKAAAVARSVQFIAEDDGAGFVLQTSAGLTFKPVAVNERSRYVLSFRARQEGSEPIEANPRLAEVLARGKSFFPSLELHFFGPDGQRIGGAPHRYTIAFGQWHAGQWLFHPPAGAVRLNVAVFIGQQGNVLSLSDVALISAADDGVININPSFSLGPFNYSGWEGGTLRVTDLGAVLLDTGYYASTTRFPLLEPGTYRIRFKASSYGRYNALMLVFLDADGKEISRFSERPSRTLKEWKANEPDGKEHEWFLTLPPGSQRAYFLIYQSLIESLSLVRVGDEGEYKKLVHE